MKVLFILLVLSLQPLHAEVNAAEERFMKGLSEGNLSTIETLLSSGFDPNAPLRGYTPLYFAMQFNQGKVVAMLLSKHADPNGLTKEQRQSDPLKVTPLQLAVQLGDVEIASMLIAAGAGVDARGPARRTALHYAARGNGHLGAIQLLLANGADLKIRDADGASPLDYAVLSGAIQAIAILLAHNAPLNDPNTQTGLTPIHEAAHRGDPGVVRYLLQFHPELGIPDKNGYLPLDHAIRMRKADCAVLLLEAGPKEQQTPQFLAKALATAISNDQSVLVEALLRHGAPVNDPLSSGATPLGLAVTSGATKVASVLLDHGADPNVSGANGGLPLQDASLKGFDHIVALLLDHGAAVNQIEAGSGATALYAAASFGKTAVVKLLLDRGANPSLCGNHRTSPYQAAVENGFSDVATIIVSHGGAKSCAP